MKKGCLVKRKIGIAVLSLFALAACTSMPGPGDREPMVAAQDCALREGGSYQQEGHLYTTLAVAKSAGYDRARQLTLAYYSQYPDMDKNYDAVYVAVVYLPVFWEWDWRNSITGVLHSLHGGSYTEIAARRKGIRAAIVKTVKDPQLDWLTGLLIHAYGDSFAHTHGEYLSKDEVAYGKWIGHAIPSLLGDNPDDISETKKRLKYEAYVVELYKTLRTDEADDHAFDEFLSYVRDMKRPSDFRPNFSQVAFPEGQSYASLVAFRQCLSEGARRLTTREIRRAIDLILQE